MNKDLFVRTEYDGKDLRQVVKLFYYDDNGEEIPHEHATDACIGINTCADMGDDLEATLRAQVESRLRVAGIQYRTLVFEDLP